MCTPDLKNRSYCINVSVYGSLACIQPTWRITIYVNNCVILTWSPITYLCVHAIGLDVEISYFGIKEVRLYQQVCLR